MKTDKEKAAIYDRIVNILEGAREREENNEDEFDTSEILEKIENSINE